MKGKRNNNSLKFTAAVILAIFAAYFLMYNPVLQKPASAAVRQNSEITVNGDNANSLALHPSIAKDDNGYSIVVWGAQPNSMQNASVYYQVYDAMNQAQLTPPQDQPDQPIASLTGAITTNLSAFHTYPKVKATSTGGNFVVVWEDINGNNKYDIYARAYRNFNTPLGAAVKINSVESESDPLPSIGMDQFNTNNGYTSFAISWISTVSPNRTVVVKKMKVKFDQNSPDNITSDGNETVVATANAQEASVSMNANDEFMVTWDALDPNSNYQYQIFMQYYGSDGSAIGTNTKVNSNSIIIAQKPTIASDKFVGSRNSTDSNPRYYIIAYQGTSADQPDGGIYGRMVKCDDPNPNNSTDSDIVCSLIPVELSVNSTTSSGTPPHDPSIDTDELGNFTVAWNDGANNMYGYLYGQNYTFNFGLPNILQGNAGAIVKSGDQYQLNANTGATRGNVAISMNSGGQYGIAFQYYGQSGRDNFAEIDSDQFVSNLLKSGSETLANFKDSHTQTHVEVATAPDGSHAEVWRSDSPRGIYYTLWNNDNQVVLDSNSQPIQNVRIDNDGDVNDHDYPSISFFKDTTGNDVGRFVISWSGSAPTCVTDPDNNPGTSDATYTTDGTDIWYREIAADGTVDGSCEKKVNSATDTLGGDDAPRIEAGYYSNGALSPTDNFQVIWLHQPDTNNPGITPNIYTAFHSGSTPNPADSMADFSYATLSSNYQEADSGTGHVNGCNDCSAKNYSITFVPAFNGYSVVWTDINAQSKQGVFANSVISGSPAASNPIMVSPLNGKEHFNPDIAIEPARGTDVSDGIGIYTETASDLSSGTIQLVTAKTDNHGQTTLNTSTLVNLNSPGIYPYARIASGPFGQNYIFYDDTNPTQDNINVYGLLVFYGQNSSIQIPLGPFIANSTYLDGDAGAGQHSPSVSMNSYGKIFVGWEGNFQLYPSSPSLGTDDYQAAIGQAFNDIFYYTAFPSLDQTASQTINPGTTRTLVVPSTIDFDSKTIDTSAHQFSTKSVRDLQSNNYVELIDLQGAPATITVSATDFTLDSDGHSYIPAQNLSVKNCDQSDVTDQRCVDTVAGSASDFDLTSAETANTYCAFNTMCSGDSQSTDPKPLATKSGNNVGAWQFYPEFKLDIPPIVPPGTHSATITFTLN